MCQLCTRCLCRLPPWQDQQPQQLWQLLPSRSCASNSSSHSRSASGPQDKLVCCHPGARITLHTPCPACNYCVVATKTCADCQMHLTHELLLIFKCIYSAEGIIFTTVCGQSVCGPNRYTSEEQPKIAESLFTTRLVEAFAGNGQALQAPHCCLSMLTQHMLLPPKTLHTCCCLQAIQPGALVVHSNGGEPQAMQMVASPKIATSQAQSTSSMTPQAAQAAHALANASETLKAQAQTLKVCFAPQQ